MNLKINQNKCLGCGMCAIICPNVFEIKNGKSQIKKKADFEKNKKCLDEASKNCPVEAISLS